MTFYEQLVDQTRGEGEHFLSVPIIRRAVNSGVSRTAYLAFLGEAYHHVKQTCPLLNLAVQNCAAEDTRYRDGLLSYIEEETGHEKWILDDITAMGGDADTVRAALPGIPCRAMVGYVTYAIEHISPYAMLGMVHVLEGVSARIAEHAAESIARALGSDISTGFNYLVSHGVLDQDHTAFFEQLVNEIRDDTAKRAIIDTANVVYRLYGDIFRDIDLMEGASNAA